MRYDVGRFRRPMRRGVMEQMVSLISLGDGSTLSLDFTTGVLDSRLSFTRASTATYINSQGYVTTMAAAPTNDPTKARFDHDPTTLAPRGLLVEGASTNLCEQGQYCWGNGATQSWARSAQVHVNSVNGAAGANNVPRIDGPDGGSLTGTSLFKDSGSTFVRTNINVAVAQLTTYTFSVYVRAPSGGNPYMRLAAFNGGTWLNTTGGTTASGITITNVSGSGSVFNGVPSTAWVRIWVTFTTQALQTSATIAFYPDVDTSNAATMYVWGAQVEAASGPSSVILTGASTATRNADNCYADSISSWYTQGSGTMLFFGRPTVPSTRTMLNFSVGTNVPRIQMYGSTSTDVVCFLENPSGTGANIVFPSGTLVNGTAFKSAWAFETGNHAACINAGTVATASTSSPAVPSSGITRLNIGMRYDGFNQFNGHVISAKYWPTRLANATLQAITTL